MKKFFKFIFGIAAAFAAVGGAYYVFKNYIAKDSVTEDSFDEDTAFEAADSEDREYVSIHITAETDGEDGEDSEASETDASEAPEAPEADSAE